MFGSRVEESVYVKGLCQVSIDHPLVDVDHVGFMDLPQDAELASVLTCLITVRLQADELVKDQLREFASGMVPAVFFHADKLRSLNAKHANSHFWQKDPEAELNGYVHRVAIADLRHFHEVMIGSRPMLQFIGNVGVEFARASGHRRRLT